MLSAFSPAKLNLFLSVLGPRADGYHNIATLFARLNWGDRIVFAPRTDTAIRITGCGAIPLDDNLIYRAALALRKQTKMMRGVNIKVQKRIPQGAGLGGGSSNAATTLLNLNRLWGAYLSMEQIASIANTLGADVGFFLKQVPYALGLGVGNQLRPLMAPSLWHILLLTSTHASTHALYTDQRLIKNSYIPDAINSMAQKGVMSVRTCNQLDNSFTALLDDDCAVQTALTLCHSLPPLIQQKLAIAPRITGSGSSVFMSFTSLFWAQRAYSYLRRMQPNGTITSLLVRTFSSPLQNNYSGV